MRLKVAACIQCLSLASALLFSSAHAEPVRTARDLLGQVFAAYGGYEQLKLTTSQPTRSHCALNSTSGLSSAENSFECDILDRDGKARIEMTMLGVPVIIGFDGRNSWRQDGDWVSKATESETQLISDELRHGLTALVEGADSKSKVELAPKALVSGKSCDGLKITTPSGAVTTFYVDPASHLVLRSEYDGTDRELGVPARLAMDYSDYRTVSGSLSPYKVTYYSAGRKKGEMVAKSVDANVVIDDKAFVMPPESVVARVKDSPLVVPFEYNGNEIFIKVKVNGGAEQRWIVDTGASQSVLDKGAAGSIGTKSISTYSVTAGSKAVPLAYTTLSTVTIGDTTLNDIPVLVTDLSGIGDKPAGLIGANILKRFLVTIDFDERKLILSDPRKVSIAADASTLPTHPIFGGTAMIIKGQVDSKPPINFLVDTGASFNHLPQTLAKPFYGGSILPVGTINSIDGKPMAIGALKVKSLKLGSALVPGAVFTVAPELAGATGLFTATTMGILGNPVWSQFKTTVDYRNERLILEPQPGHEKLVRLKGELERVNDEFLKSKDEEEALKSYEKILVTSQVEQQKQIEALATARIADMYVQKYKKTKEMKWFDQALSDYERSLKIANDSHNRNVQGEVLAQWSLALLEGQRSYSEITAAQDMLSKALAKAPTDPNIFAAVGTTLLRVGKRAEAEKLIDRTLVLDPSNWHALWAKYKLYQDDKRPKEAAIVVEQLVHYYPSFPEVIALAPSTVKPSVATAERKVLPAPVPGKRKHP